MMTASATQSYGSRLRFVPGAAAAIVMVVASLALIGWATHIESLKSLGQPVPMNPTTAVSFMMAGASLWLVRAGLTKARATWIVQWLAFVVAVVGVLRLLGHWCHWTFEIDTFLFRDELRGNRVALNTAANLVLVGAALLFLGAQGRRAGRTAIVFASLSGTVSLLALAGYLYRILSFYDAGGSTPMALNTALVFLVLSLGILLAGMPADRLSQFRRAWPFERTVTLGFALALVLLCSVAAATHHSFKRLLAGNRSDKHTVEAIDALHDLGTTVRDAETGQRGYVITGQQAYLEPYNWALKSVNNNLGRLRAMISDEPAQVRRLAALEPLVAEKMAELRHTVLVRSEQGFAATLPIILGGQGKSYMDGIRSLLLEMVAEEDASLQQRQRDEVIATNKTLWTIGVGSLMAIALVTLAGFLVRRDIVARRRAEEALRLSEEECRVALRQAAHQAEVLNGVLESVGHGVIVADKSGVIIISNPDANRLVGAAPADTQQSLWSQQYGCFLPDEITVFPTFELPLSKAVRGEHTNDVELFIRNPSIPDGVHISVTGRPLKGGDGEAAGGVVVFHDVTERRRVQAELQRAKDAAEAAALAKSEFLAHMSHEIRTPLNGVVGMLDLLISTNLTSQQRRFAELAKSSGDSLASLLNDILDFSKIEAGKLEIESLDFDLRKSIEDVVEILAQRASQKGLEMACHVHPSLPSLVRGDPDRLRQILTNLVANAVKFTESGGVAIHVALQDQTSTHLQVRVAVTDTGVGIPRDRMDRLFKSFSQVDASTTRVHGGTGLGLAISKQLAQLMGGEIGVESAPGKGSSFWFTLRLEKQLQPDLGLCLPGQTQGLRILAVDDNPTSREVLRQQIVSWGLDAATARNGERALKILDEAALSGTPYNVAIIDSDMPGMNGVELGKTIKAKAEFKDTVLMILLTLDDDVDPMALREMGFAGHMTKPIRQSQLFDGIMNAIATAATPSALLSPPIAASEKPEDRAVTPKGVRILLAEDNRVNQIVAGEILSKSGYLYDVVGDGAKALEALQDRHYDLVLMDCQMPTMDGFEATRAIRRREAGVSHIPIIALTANAIKGDRERCLEAGMDAYCSKPVNARKLVEAMVALLPKTPVPPQGQTPCGTAAAVPSLVIPAAAQPFDLDAVLERCMNNAAIVSQVFEEFEAQAAGDIDRLKKSLRESDGNTCARVAHGLKGAAGVLSAEVLSQIAAQMEQMGRMGELGPAGECLARLEIELRRCVEYTFTAKREMAGRGLR